MIHTHKIDTVGELYTTTSGGITCYDIFTKAGNYRGGKIYSSEKKYIILSGMCELTVEQNGEDVTKIITPETGIYHIDANVPHIFYFPEDTRLIEWFSEDTQYQDFERYRAMKK